MKRFILISVILAAFTLNSCTVEQHLVASDRHLQKAEAKGFKPVKVIDTLYITRVDSVWNDRTQTFVKYDVITDTVYKTRDVYKYLTRQERKHLRDSAAFALKTLKEKNDFALKMKDKENKALKVELAKERQKSKQVDDVEDTKQAEARSTWLSFLFVFLGIIGFIIVLRLLRDAYKSIKNQAT